MDRSVALHPAGEAETLWVLGDRVRFAGALPGTDFLLVEVEVSPGGGTPLHSHASPELFRVLSGEVAFMAREDGAWRQATARAGDVLSVPSGVAHGYRNDGSVAAVLLVVLDRTMEAFFRDIGDSMPRARPPGPDDLARIGAACARHGVVLLEGPPPG